MGNPIMGGCPYQAEDGYNDRNRFPHGHLFVGEIENGKRYPLGVYTKEESDALYAGKQTEDDLADLADIVSQKADESECVDIRARLDALEYQEMKINSFSASPATCELGTSAQIDLSWSLNKPAVYQTIDGMPASGSSAQFSNVTSSHTYTLYATDGKTTASRQAAVEFANQIYYGAAEDLTNVTALSKTLSNKKTRTINVTANEGEYIIYAIPARLGSVVFYVGGFEGGFEDPVEQSLMNSSGYQETYRVYRSTQPNLGNTTVEVKEA